jgi:hypothetical protein
MGINTFRRSLVMAALFMGVSLSMSCGGGTSSEETGSAGGPQTPQVSPISKDQAGALSVQFISSSSSQLAQAFLDQVGVQAEVAAAALDEGHLNCPSSSQVVGPCGDGNLTLNVEDCTVDPGLFFDQMLSDLTGHFFSCTGDGLFIFGELSGSVEFQFAPSCLIDPLTESCLKSTFLMKDLSGILGVTDGDGVEWTVKIHSGSFLVEWTKEGTRFFRVLRGHVVDADLDLQAKVGPWFHCVIHDDVGQCEPDSDKDGVVDSADNCPNDANPGQEDGDGDGVGDKCDNCPDVPNPDQSDRDIDYFIGLPDGVGDACDNCPDVYNPNQVNTAGADFGDLCVPQALRCLAVCDLVFRSECAELGIPATNPDGTLAEDCLALIAAKGSCGNGNENDCFLDLNCTQDSDCVLNALSCVNGGCQGFNPALCGNCQCDTDKGELCSNCPGDCGECPFVCTSGESCEVADDCADWFSGVPHGDTDHANCSHNCCVVVTLASACGDDSCQVGETAESCPTDCATNCDAGCSKKCPRDCPFILCGDGQCDPLGYEDCRNCTADCGTCEPCGDHYCDSCDLRGNGAETCGNDDTAPSCKTDCGICNPVFCGNRQCDSKDGETCENCPEDCCGVDVCPDATCGPTEDCHSCPQDCGTCPICGDQICNGEETCFCSDCPCDQGMTCNQAGECVAAACPNGVCDADEDYVLCPSDCGTFFCEPNMSCSQQGFQCVGPSAFKVCASPSSDICPLLSGQTAISCLIDGQAVQAACDVVAQFLGPSTCNGACCVCAPTEQVEATCSDGLDNDCDGLIDCKDDDCNGSSGGQGTCQFGTETTCNDSFDNDGNGLTDCADPNCNGLVCDQNNDVCTNGACAPPSICGNGIMEGNEVCDDGRNNGSCGFCNLSCSGPTICK